MGAFFPASLECRPLGKISLCPGVATEAFFLKHLNAGCAPAQKEHSCLYLQEAFHLHCCSLNAKQQPFLNTAGVGTAVLCLGMASFWGKIRLSHKPTSFMPHLSERGIANFYLNDSSEKKQPNAPKFLYASKIGSKCWNRSPPIPGCFSTITPA